MLRRAPPARFSATLSGATKIWYRLPRLGQMLRSTDLPGDVGAVGRRYTARCGEGLRVDRLAEAINVRLSAVVRALHLNVKRSHVMVVQVHRLSVGAVYPLAVVARNQCDSGIRRTEAIAACGRMGPGDARRERQAHQA